MAAYQSSKLRGTSDYYDYYDSYPRQQVSAQRRLGLQMRNNRLGRPGGAGLGGLAGLYGGYSNSNQQEDVLALKKF